MYNFPILDLVVIALYFLIVIGIGIWSMRRIKNQEDYFLAGRRFGKFVQTFADFGQGTSASTCVGVTTTTYSNGAAGIWGFFLYLFATPLYWMIVPWLRRLRVLTTGVFFEERYGSKRMAGVYAIIGAISMTATISVGFIAMTKTVVALAPKQVSEFSAGELTEYNLALELDDLKNADYKTLNDSQKQRFAELTQRNPRKFFSHINENVLIWVVCLAVLIYAVAGGLEAVMLTDVMQSMFIIILSVILIPFGWSKINSIYGGSGFLDAMRTMHTRLPESFFEIFGSPTTIDFTWYYILAISLLEIINSIVLPNALVAAGSAKSEYPCRFGYVVGCFIKRFVTVFWCFFALMAVVLYRDKVYNPDLVWGYATLDLLGPLKIGLVGLMTACLMAALMSTADTLMITGSGLLTHNIYRPLVSGKSERHYIFVGRTIGSLILIGAAVIAVQFDTILQIVKLSWEINVMVAASFWLGMKWRRANRISAWCSIIVTTMLFFVLPMAAPALWPSLRTNSYLLKTTKPEPVVKIYTAHQIDVDARERDIESWEKLSDSEKAGIPRPQLLESGKKFEKTYRLPNKSIFWTKGIKINDDDGRQGYGALNLSLVLFDKLGWDLSSNPYAVNETIRILLRTGIPFLILLIIALLTKPDDKKMLDRFFVKMKTEVLADHAADARELEESYANPARFNHKKLFPNSNWEFDKWDKVDYVGLSISVLGVFAVLGLLMFLVTIGK